MKKGSFKNLMDFLSLDYKKEQIKIIIFNLLFILTISTVYFFLIKQLLVLLVGLFIILLFNFFFFNQYTKKKAILIEQRDDELIQLITIFETFINNRNNVYQSLVKLMDYSSLWMRDNLKILLEGMDEDKTVQPFVEFANHFSLKMASNIMVSIYQMIDSGSSLAELNHFTLLFMQVSKARHDELIKKKERSFDMVSMLPMVGAAMITIILSFSIVMILGDIVNVF